MKNYLKVWRLHTSIQRAHHVAQGVALHCVQNTHFQKKAEEKSSPELRHPDILIHETLPNYPCQCLEHKKKLVIGSHQTGYEYFSLTASDGSYAI